MNHTLVIPTYNRPDLVRRLVAYYLKRSTPIAMLVLDSSKAEVAAQNAQWMAANASTVRHIVFPETTPVAVKLSQGLAHVTTAYASFCADDDIVFPQGLEDAVRFLAGNPDYACAHGLYLNFQIHSGSDKVNIWREYGGPANDAGHAGARIFRLFQNYESLFYAVFRTADLKEIAAGVATIPSLHFQELFQSVATLIKGKVKRLPGLYAARQSIAAAEPERDNWQTYYWFASNPAEILEHYRNYCDSVWSFYESRSEESPLSRSDFQRVLDLSHAVYFSAGCPPAYFHSILQAYWPNDRFVDPGNQDMFGQLGSGNTASPVPRSKWTPRYVLSAARLVLRAARYAPYQGSLNWRAKRLGGTPWDCRLPWNLRWLAAQPEFRRTYMELCQYLDTR
jgi:glycosyltransferase domain-containing protein